ncbi:MAG: putative toxin-antitoxin system toxin component, PIN family [Polyangiales bacterium]
MPLIVVDTNVLISAAIKRDGLEARVLALCAEGRIETAVSDALEAEYRAVSARKKFAKQAERLVQLTETLVRGARRITVTEVRARCSDPDDDMVLACASSAGARYLVTGNSRDFPRELESLRVLNARELLVALQELADER